MEFFYFSDMTEADMSFIVYGKLKTAFTVCKKDKGFKTLDQMQSCLYIILIKLFIATNHSSLHLTLQKNGIEKTRKIHFGYNYTFVYYSLLDLIYEKIRFQMIFLWTLEMLE